MTVWSDLDSAGPAGAPVAHRLVDGVARGQRVLVAGAHETELVGRLCEIGAEVTLLLRSRPDAVRAARELPDVTVCCGSLPRFAAPAGGYDVVVALGDVDRLCSTDGPELGWAEALERLLAAARPEGEMWLAVENMFSAHRIVQIINPTVDQQPWSLLRECDLTRPATIAALQALLTAHGWNPAESYAGFGQPTRPGLIVRVGSSLDRDDTWTAGLVDLAAAAAGAAAAAAKAGPVLRNPGVLVSEAVRRGLAAQLASSWLVRIGHPAACPPAPVLLARDGPPGWQASWQVVAGSHGWERVVLSGAPARVGLLQRDPAALAGQVPAGRVLEEALITGCVRRDLPSLRRMLRHYAAWLAGHAGEDGQLSGRAVMATPGNVVLAGDRHTILDPSWSAGTAVPLPVGLARGLGQVAAALVAHGHVHPWPSGSSPVDLTMVMTGAAGHDIDRQVVERAAELASVLQPAGEQVELVNYQQTSIALASANRRWEYVQAKLVWYEWLLASREAALRRTEFALRALRRTPAYQVARLVLRPVRWARAWVRRAPARLKGR